MDPVRSASNPSGPLSTDPLQDGGGASGATPAVQSLPPGVCSSNPDVASDVHQQLAVRSLLEAYGRPPLRLPDENSTTSAATPRTDNNAARTSSSEGSGSYAQAGYTRNGDGVFLGVAAMKQHESRAGTDVEVFTASAQFGAQNEVQAGLVRVGGGRAGDALDANVSAEFLTARVNAGIHNDDDSQGANLGAMLTGAGAELTVGHSGWSGTFGLSASLGAAVSSGDRNIDGDETPERCFKGSLGPLTLGFCTEFR